MVGVVGGEEDGLWQCELCEKTFKNERYLARHKQLHGLPSFDCEYCGKKFIRKVINTFSVYSDNLFI
jgi:ribosomal protein L37AE/L43A